MRRILLDVGNGQAVHPTPGHTYSVVGTSYRVNDDINNEDGDILFMYVDMTRPPTFVPMDQVPGIWAAR